MGKWTEEDDGWWASVTENVERIEELYYKQREETYKKLDEKKRKESERTPNKEGNVENLKEMLGSLSVSKRKISKETRREIVHNGDKYKTPTEDELLQNNRTHPIDNADRFTKMKTSLQRLLDITKETVVKHRSALEADQLREISRQLQYSQSSQESFAENESSTTSKRKSSYYDRSVHFDALNETESITNSSFLRLWCETVSKRTHQKELYKILTKYTRHPPTYSLVFRITISFTSHNQPNYEIIHHIPKATISNRAFRKYGSHRFIRIHFTLKEGYRKSVVDEYVFNFMKKNQEKGIEICKRIYKLAHIKFSEQGGFSCYYFAVNSLLPNDIPPVSLHDFRQWHLPRDENQKISINEYIARFDMAFSSTIPSITLKNTAIQEIPDVYSDAGFQMTDGCAPISVDLMKEIWADWKKAKSELRKNKNSSIFFEETYFPAAFQGRLGSYKGVWYVDPSIKHCCVRPSMKKYSLVAPDAWQRTIEICKMVCPPKCASMNRQFLVLLETIQTPQSQQDGRLLNALLKVQKRDLLNVCNFRNRAVDVKSYIERVPTDDRNAQIYEMLKIRCWNDPYLQFLLDNLQDDRYLRILHQSHFLVPYSTRLLIIADPFGLLEEDEVYCSITGLGTLSMQILACRNPCYHPGDIRILKSVNAGRQYRPFKDILVLSTKGRRPVADMMSGGDYDGDTVWVCWDQNIIGILQQQTPANYACAISTTTYTENPVSMKSFQDNEIFSCFMRANDCHNSLGRLSNAHLLRSTRVNERANDEGCLFLAESLSRAVDQRKSGCRVVFPNELEETTFPLWFQGEKKRLRNSTGSFIDILYQEAYEFHKIIDAKKIEQRKGFRAEDFVPEIFRKVLDHKILEAYSADAQYLWNEYEQRIYSTRNSEVNRFPIDAWSMKELEKERMKQKVMENSPTDRIVLGLACYKWFLDDYLMKIRKGNHAKISSFAWDMFNDVLSSYVDGYLSGAEMYFFVDLLTDEKQ